MHGWSAGFLLFYIIIVGPPTSLSSGRASRNELAWFSIPVFVVLSLGACLCASPVGLKGGDAVQIRKLYHQWKGSDVATLNQSFGVSRLAQHPQAYACREQCCNGN